MPIKPEILNPQLVDRLKNIRAVLFDKDGTLIDFDQSWFSISMDMALQAAQGNEQKARSLMDAGGYDWDAGSFRANSIIASGTVEDMVALWYPEASHVEVSDIITDLAAKSEIQAPISAVAVNALHETLEVLKARGFVLGIATNDSEASAIATAKALKIDHYFQVIIGYDTAARPKPFADPIVYFAEKTGVQLSEIAMVGDNLHDLESAHAAKAGLAIGVTSGNSSRAELEPRADLVLGSIADLPELLLR